MNYQDWHMIDIASIMGSRFDRVNVFYSNPDYYTEQKKLEFTAPSPIEWPTKAGDFFPYSDCPHCFWTGYFTSRAAFKRFERVASSFLMAARQIDAMSLPDEQTLSCKDTDSNPLFPLEDALGIAQHHDAISGTAKQHVADDYSKKLSGGMNTVSAHVMQKLKDLMLGKPSDAARPGSEPLENLSYCPLLNETICQPSVVRYVAHIAIGPATWKFSRVLWRCAILNRMPQHQTVL
jgi:Alpha mannosidase middle domain